LITIAVPVGMLLGLLWGEPWYGVLLRGATAPLLLLGLFWLYAANTRARRVLRVGLGIPIGTLCALTLGADALTASLVVAGYTSLLLACELLIQRDAGPTGTK
jgi:hypothetical protein